MLRIFSQKMRINWTGYHKVKTSYSWKQDHYIKLQTFSNVIFHFFFFFIYVKRYLRYCLEKINVCRFHSNETISDALLRYYYTLYTFSRAALLQGIKIWCQQWVLPFKNFMVLQLLIIRRFVFYKKYINLYYFIVFILKKQT